VLIEQACLIPYAAGDSLNSDAVDIYNVTSGDWSTAKLSEARRYIAATSLPNQGLAIFAGGASACRYMLIFDALRLYWFMLRMVMRGQ